MLRLLIAALTGLFHEPRNGADRHWLDHLDAHTLRDIGMTRHEVEMALRRSSTDSACLPSPNRCGAGARG